MKDKRTSYTSADSLPVKLMKNEDVIKSINANKGIPPIHAQFIPTNRCNMHCSFCSCSEIDRKKEMSLEDSIKIIDDLAELGSKAVTVTGGGEPLMHPQINEILGYFHNKNIQIGLVTNGKLLRKLTNEGAKGITWCRISNGDERTFNPSYESVLSHVVARYPHIDWAFSHVVSTKPNINEIKKVIKFANDYKFTHVRLVADLFQPDKVPMETLESTLKAEGVKDNIVIYQGRKQPRHGGDCYIGYLKPLISADAKVYACCGVQYAFEPAPKTLPEELCLGSAFNMKELMKKSRIPLDGNVCTKCYYTDYNNILEAMLKNVEHKEFV